MSSRELIQALFKKTEEIATEEISDDERLELMEVATQIFKLESEILKLVGVHRHSW
jgi:hypothetical protein